MQTKFLPEGYHDVHYAGAFAAQLLGVLLWICISAGSGKYAVPAPASFLALAETLRSGDARRDRWGAWHAARGHGAAEAASGAEQGELLALIALASLAVAAIFGGIWLAMLKIMPVQIVKVAFVSLPVTLGVLTLIVLASGQMFGAVLLALFTALSVYFVHSVWDRVEFTGRLFKTVSEMYSRSSAIFLVTVLLIGAQFAWMFVWLIAAVPAMNGPTVNGGALVLLMFSFFWTYNVIRYVLYVSCGGVVARHYFNEQTNEAVGKSTKSACTNYLGSICLGSLIIAIVQTLKWMAEQAKSQAEEDGNPVGICLSCMASCILSMIEDVMQFINAWAFSYISIYGMSFCDAGRKVWELLVESECESLLSFNLVGIVSTFGCLSGGLFTCLLAALMAWRASLAGGFILAAAVIGFLCGLAIMSVVSSIMEAGTTTLFVCFAESPSLLRGIDTVLLDQFSERKRI